MYGFYLVHSLKSSGLHVEQASIWDRPLLPFAQGFDSGLSVWVVLVAARVVMVTRRWVVPSHMAQEELAVRTGVRALLAWKRLARVVAPGVEVHTLLLDAKVRREIPVRFTEHVYIL